MNREHPTGTERKSLNYECGWKGGDRGGLAGRKKFAERKRIVEKSKKLLTGVGLLMEGASLANSQRYSPCNCRPDAESCEDRCEHNQSECREVVLADKDFTAVGAKKSSKSAQIGLTGFIVPLILGHH